MSITRLKNIETIILYSNQIEYLPSEIGQCKNLKYLSLSDNKLTEIPETFWQLTSLEKLYLDNNAFPQDLKESIREWAELNLISLTL